MTLFIGLMSGTSLDGVDGVLADVAAIPILLAHVHQPFEIALRAELLALNQPGQADEGHRMALAGNSVALAYAHTVQALLHAAGVAGCAVRAIGAHGQTVRHRPGEFDGHGYTLQLLNGALLAELSGIDVVCDLRSRDVAAGGQGAPLVPAFHAAMFARPGMALAVLNLGGIANLSLLGADGSVRGFDCGPGNALMDLWVQHHLGAAFDADGAWASSASVDDLLLASLLAEPYLARRPPKSTGRDLFNAGWLQHHLDRRGVLPAAQVQATLLEFTARTALDALRSQAPTTSQLRVCGGGARNTRLMARLAALWPGLDVQPTDNDGVAAEHVEALAFAWLAQAFVVGQAGNLPAVTGARGLRRLGALYPA
jgi:anhydro-N-acetylmuramic acid kinase